MDERLDTACADAVIAAIAGRQYGVVSFRQLIDAGLGRSAIAHRVRTGRLHRLHRGVFAVGHLALAREGWWTGAVLACGEGAALSHASGAALWDVRASSARLVDVAVPSTSGRAARSGIRVHRLRSLAEEDITTHRGIRVTTFARTLLDLAALLKGPALARALERAEILELFDLIAVQRTLDRNANHRGAARLAAALDAYRENEPTRSELEARFLALCGAHDLPRPLANHPLGGIQVDFCWPGPRLVVELDGHRTHRTRAAFERDRARDVQLTLAGWRVVRFTYRQIERDPDSIAAALRALLAPTPAR